MKIKSAFIRYPGLIVLTAVAIVVGGSKPPGPSVIQEQGIKVTSFTAPIWGGMNLEWETTDERIDLGSDEFVIRVSDRQIPARTGWSAWREVGRTTNTSFSVDGFWRSRDIRLKVEVDKGVIE